MTGWVSACGNSTCIEVMPAPKGCLPGVWVRAGGNDDHILSASAEEWWQFLDGVKAGAFDDVIPREQL